MTLRYTVAALKPLNIGWVLFDGHDFKTQIDITSVLNIK